MRARGYLSQVVERWNPHANIRQDLFQIIDVLGVCELGTLGVQSTSYQNLSARVKKIAESETIADIRKAGWSIEVHGWRKVNNRWQVKIVDVS